MSYALKNNPGATSFWALRRLNQHEPRAFDESHYQVTRVRHVAVHDGHFGIADQAYCR